jgi:hypothetical protein
MTPLLPPLPTLPDWRLQLLAGAVILWVLGTYAVLLWAEWVSTRRTHRITCPLRETPATVQLRIDGEERPTDVLRCSLEPDGVTCDKTCLARMTA